MTNLYFYNNNNIRIVCTNDNIPKLKKEKNYFIKKDDSDTLRCSLSRSKRMIREYSLCNDFTYFFTCTVNSKNCDRFSLSETQKNMRKIMKAIQRKNNEFKYLFITEKHKNGAFHFHGLCTNLLLYTNDNGYYSSLDFDKLGFNSFSAIKDKNKISNYITKYITKDCVRNESGSVYFCSRGLKTADKYEIYNLDLFHNLSKKPFENDFCSIYDIQLDKLTSQELLFLINNIKTIDKTF